MGTTGEAISPDSVSVKTARRLWAPSGALVQVKAHGVLVKTASRVWSE